jgi:3-hydroxyacyl-CoA dehydrogenase/enoyl-CoA hydratase/3-hydroxybutyryl-CoA epimerase
VFPCYDYDKEEEGRRLLFAVVIDPYKCLDSGGFPESKGAYIDSVLGFICIAEGSCHECIM